MKRQAGEGSAGKSSDMEQLLLEVATCYYELRMTQEEISKRINTSRSTVSRLLDEARECGIVHIRINYPWQRSHDLEQKLVGRFGLREARVLVGKGRQEEELRRGMGDLAARLLDSLVTDNQVLGVSYGRSLASTIAALDPSRKVSMSVVPIIGAVGSENPAFDGPDLVHRFAKAYGAEYRYLPVPLLVEDVRTRDALMQLPTVYETLNIARRADIVILGIGSLSTDVTSGIWKGYLENHQLRRIHQEGAVGYMCGQFYDARGRLLDLEINRRSIGIGVRALTRIESVIAVASGNAKVEAILGAVRGKYTNMLVTDDVTANAALELDNATEPRAHTVR